MNKIMHILVMVLWCGVLCSADSTKTFCIFHDKEYFRDKRYDRVSANSVEALNAKFDSIRCDAARDTAKSMISWWQMGAFAGGVALTCASGAVVCGKKAYFLSKQRMALPPVAFRRSKALLFCNAAFTLATASWMAVRLPAWSFQSSCRDLIKKKDEFNEIAQNAQVHDMSSNQWVPQGVHDVDATTAFQKAQPRHNFFSWIRLGLAK